jgi:VanZ family protein
MSAIISILIYTLFIFYVTLYPFALKSFSPAALLENTYKLFHPSNIKFTDLDIFANLVIFGILGGLCAVFFSDYKDREETVLGALYVALYAFMLNSIIEILQASIPGRFSSLIDIGTSVIAAVSGYLSVAILKDVGVIKFLAERYKPILRENPVRLLWTTMAAAFFIGGTYPFRLVPDLSCAAKRMAGFGTSLFLPDMLSSRFFLEGIPYLVWGASAVVASMKGDGEFLGRVVKKTTLSFALIVFIESCKLFIVTRQPSLHNICAYAFWMCLGACIAYPYALKYKRYPMLRSSENANRSIGEFFRLCFVLTGLLIFLKGLQPFNFCMDASSIRAQISGAELIPFRAYINNFNILTIWDAMQKSALYFALGLEIFYYILHKRLMLTNRALAYSAIACGLVAASVTTLQLLVPGRLPSVSDILIASGSGFAGAVFARYIFLSHQYFSPPVNDDKI